MHGLSVCVPLLVFSPSPKGTSLSLGRFHLKILLDYICKTPLPNQAPLLRLWMDMNPLGPLSVSGALAFLALLWGLFELPL